MTDIATHKSMSRSIKIGIINISPSERNQPNRIFLKKYKAWSVLLLSSHIVGKNNEGSGNDNNHIPMIEVTVEPYQFHIYYKGSPLSLRSVK